MSSDSHIDRRSFLGAGVAAGTATGMLGAGATGQAGELPQLAARATLVLHDPRIPLDAAAARQLAANGARIITLSQDPVRQWREEAAEALRQPGTRLLGLTRWADFLMIRGLAAESRRHVLYERLDANSGVMTWLIGRRG